jgi:hypothetical protein
VGGYDYTSTLRTRRRRARLKAERLEAVRAAKMARRIELDRKRAAMGLPPAKTSTERARECRERQAAGEQIIRTQSWYSPSFRDWREAKAYLTGLKPGVPEQAIENVLEVTHREAQKWQLFWNRFVTTNGTQAARVKRAILWQILDVRFGGDMTHIKAAMKQAQTRLDITTTEGAHPTQVYQEKGLALDMSQIMLREGGILNVEE